MWVAIHNQFNKQYIIPDRVDINEIKKFSMINKIEEQYGTLKCNLQFKYEMCRITALIISIGLQLVVYLNVIIIKFYCLNI